MIANTMHFFERGTYHTENVESPALFDANHRACKRGSFLTSGLLRCSRELVATSRSRALDSETKVDANWVIPKRAGVPIELQSS